MYDIIGDIHGHAARLQSLLEKLGYAQESDQCYRHATRQVIFVGDFIDRGPQIREVLETVRAMVEGGSALTVMGNHEYNAIAYSIERLNEPGHYLRRHNEKNTGQYQQTLNQLSPDELEDWVGWFRTLPAWLELDDLRVVHASWNPPAMALFDEVLQQYGHFTDDFMHAACDTGSELFRAVETVLKGVEVPLPDGVTFADKDGNVRHKFRSRWYASPIGQTVRSYVLGSDSGFPDLPLSNQAIAAACPYSPDEIPVFVGHYWLRAENPSLLASNVACVDYSVAKGGFLCAYRWNGEANLSDENFVTV
ncbi:MAG: diadenosine tetraphosphatase [Planctomycetaceae bacterium]|nr:diadenosine tetraphosphatase [Planctomycetaceae bacterium]